MELKCIINGVEYGNSLVQGITFTEEYNETLDSGTIIINGISQMIDLKPYDDVYIFDATYFDDYFTAKEEHEKPCKHLLVDDYSEELINIDSKIYRYTINLMSETKKLEVIQLPNTSITQPLNFDKKRSVWAYLEQYVQQYSPMLKVAISSDKWVYKRKYTLDNSLKAIFENVYCPDFTLNAPSLKDILTQLMLVKDTIPYVEDDVIKGLDISKRKGTFNFDTNAITNIVGSMSSSNYANNLKRGYSNALSQRQSTRRIEYMGFRNSDDALLTLENIRLETSFPIYKINKIYMCYYKTGEVLKIGGDSYNPPKYKTFLCKQDITDLVLLNSTRNLLSKDWNDFNEDTSIKPNSIQELAKYRLCTVGYDIGGKYITGWGEKYTYPNGWWDVNRTYVENILLQVDRLNPFGIYDYGYVAKEGNLAQNEILDLLPIDTNWNSPASNFALNMKTLLFKIDYNSLYNGAVVHSKEEDYRDDITINDNSSSSLTLLEKDGLFQKEKLNRFGNKAIQINATYTDINDLQDLGSVYDDDIVIYHREYNINDKCVMATYYGTKDYVLKNYFTSVYAKHRTYNLMSYGESVNRQENRKIYINLSKDTAYYEINDKINFNVFSVDYMKLLFSAFIPSERYITIGNQNTPNKINAGFISYTNSENITKKYLCDVNGFVSGYSLCFNLKMYDNVSMGAYIKDFEPTNVLQAVKDDFTGSVQDWNFIVDDRETGFAKELGFYVSHIDNKEYLLDKVIDGKDVDTTFTDKLFQMPLINEKSATPSFTNLIGNKFLVNKDNKEVLDMTLQLEPITNDRNILFSQWLMKLSDLLSTYEKVDVSYKTNEDSGQSYYDINANVKYITYNGMPLILLELNKVDWDNLDKNKEDLNLKSNEVLFPDITQAGLINEIGMMNSYSVLLQQIKSMTNDLITIGVKQRLAITETNLGLQIPNINENATIGFHKIDKLGDSVCPSDKVWFANLFLTFNQTATLYDDAQIIYKDNGATITPTRRFYNFKTTRDMNNTQDINTTAYIQELSIASGGKVEPHNKNMFILTSDEPLKKTLVYDEYGIEDTTFTSKLDKSTLVSDKIYYYENTKKIPTIKISLDGVSNTTKSLQYWYLNEDSKSYNFVFGVNITQEDITKGYVEIYLSTISSKDIRVFNDNHEVVGYITNYNNTTKEYGKGQYFDLK